MTEELFVMFDEKELGEIYKHLPEGSDLRKKVEECLRTRQVIRVVNELNIKDVRTEV